MHLIDDGIEVRHSDPLPIRLEQLHDNVNNGGKRAEELTAYLICFIKGSHVGGDAPGKRHLQQNALNSGQRPLLDQ